MKILAGLLLTLSLVGCASHRAPIESAVPSMEETTLSGAPCLDGLFANLEERCLYPVAGDSPYGDYVEVGCSIPLAPREGDLLYDGYTTLTFRVYDNEVLEFADVSMDDVAFFCSDTAVTVGFEIPIE